MKDIQEFIVLNLQKNFFYVWVFFKIKISTFSLLPRPWWLRPQPHIPQSFRAGFFGDSLVTGMYHLSPSQGVSLWGFLFLGGDGKVCSFCLLCRWEQKRLGTLQCTIVLCSVKAHLPMSECFWLCGWQSSSAIQLTCSWCYANESVSMFMAGRWVTNPRWRNDFKHRSHVRAGPWNNCSGLLSRQAVGSLELFFSRGLFLSCNWACFSSRTCHPDFFLDNIQLLHWIFLTAYSQITAIFLTGDEGRFATEPCEGEVCCFCFLLFIWVLQDEKDHCC